jgi:hypothetical protein
VAVTGLAGRIDNHGKRTVQVDHGAPLFGEKCLRRQRAYLALHLDGDPLPGSKMPRIALQWRAGRYIEKTLYAGHGSLGHMLNHDVQVFSVGIR